MIEGEMQIKCSLQWLLDSVTMVSYAFMSSDDENSEHKILEEKHARATKEGIRAAQRLGGRRACGTGDRMRQMWYDSAEQRLQEYVVPRSVYVPSRLHRSLVRSDNRQHTSRACNTPLSLRPRSVCVRCPPSSSCFSRVTI